MKRIKWKNVIKSGVLLICLSVMLHDMGTILYGVITGQSIGFTHFGFITFLFITGIASTLFDDLEEQIKNVANLETVTTFNN